MFDQIIYIEIFLVLLMIVAQKAYTDGFTKIVSNVSLSVMLTVMLGWFISL